MTQIFRTSNNKSVISNNNIMWDCPTAPFRSAVVSHVCKRYTPQHHESR